MGKRFMIRDGRFTIVVCLLAMVTTLAFPPAGAAEKIVSGHMWEDQTAQHHALVWAAQEVEHRFSGRYHMDVFPKGQLGATDAELAENQGGERPATETARARARVPG